MKSSGFYNQKFDKSDVQFLFSPGSSFLNPKSLREVCGNEPICGVPKNWFKACWSKRDAWLNCKTQWQINQATTRTEDVTTPAGDGRISTGDGTTPDPTRGGGSEGVPEKQEQKTNVWIWVSAIIGFLFLILIIILLIRKSN